jgi:hypothetical protein
MTLSTRSTFDHHLSTCTIFLSDCLEDWSGWEIGEEESQRYCRGFKMLISKEMGHSAKEVFDPVVMVEFLRHGIVLHVMDMFEPPPK